MTETTAAAPATDNAPAKPEMNEVAGIKRDITYPSFMGLLANRDDTLLTRGGGKGLKLYDEIERDCHAFAVLQKRKLAVIARQWEVQPASDSPLDKKAADLVTRQLTNMNIDQVTVDLLDALLKGYAVGEIMWAVDGSEIVAQRVIARDQRRFVFGDRYELRMLTLSDLLRGEEMPPRKFLVHSFGAKDASPYGRGLGTRLFWPVFFKRQDITFWLTFADKFGSPTAIGKYPVGASKTEKDTLLEALAAIAQDTGITVPEGMVIEYLEAQRSGSTDAYEKLAKYMDDQISEAVLGETMSTSAKSSGLGSSQANVHNEVRLELVKADADLLSGMLNATLLPWLTEFNVPGAKPPKFWRKVEEEKDLAAQAERDKLIFDMGYKPTLDYIVNTYGGEWIDAPPPKPTASPAANALGALNAAFAEAAAAATLGQTAIDNAGGALPDAKLQAQMAAMLTPVLDLIKSGASYTAIMTKLAQTFPLMDTAALEELLARAIFVADLWGGATLSNAAADVGAD